MVFTVTLKQLRENSACFDGYNKAVRMLQGKPFTGEDQQRESYIRFAHKDQISLVDICNNNGLDDALWAARCLTGHDRDLRLYAVWCARQVQDLMEDQRSIAALDVAERFANGNASHGELVAARAAALDAARTAASDAARVAARDAALDVTRDSASGAAWAACAVAGASEWVVARTAGRAAAWAAQKEMFIAMCEGHAPWQDNR